MNLKRTLALVLAVVMVLGMFGIASASFTDDATIQYKEAVEVMTGIGAIDGMGDGTFNPKGPVTRAQAAKMVAYAVLGKDLAQILPVTKSSFTDVNEYFNWAIPSIEYLVQQGAINGRGDGTFDPNGQVTGLEIGKMLLCALGYGKEGEFTGTGWDLNVALKANELKLFAGSKATSTSAHATREECALYTFNALFLNRVTPQYQWDNGVQHVVGYTEVKDSSIAQVVYGLKADPTVVGGLNGYVWTYKGKEISSFYTDEIILATFNSTAGMTKGQMYNKAKWSTEANAKVKVVINGSPEDDVAVSDLANRGSSDAVAYQYNGAVIHLIDTPNDKGVADGIVDKVVISVDYLAVVTKVNKATASADRSIVVTVYDAGKTLTGIKIETKDFAEKDYILITPSTNGADGFKNPVAMVNAKAVQAVPTAFKAGTSVTFGGKTYAYNSGITLGAATAKAADGYSFTATYNFFFDAYGNILGVSLYEAGATPLNYIYVTAVQSQAAGESLISGSSNAIVKVMGTLLDGTIKVFDYNIKTAASTANGLTKGDSYITLPDGSNKAVITAPTAGDAGVDAMIAAGLYSYTVNDDGKITLSNTKSVTIGGVKTEGAVAGGKVTITKGDTEVKVASATSGVAASSTEVVLSTSGGITKYVGYANFVTQDFDVSKTPVVFITKGTVITNILVVGGAPKADTTANYGIYLSKGSTVSTGVYYNFFVDGEAKALLVPKDSLPTVGAALDAADSKAKFKITLSDGALVGVDAATVVGGAGDAVTFIDPTFVQFATAGVVALATDTKVYDITGGDPSTWGTGTLAVGDYAVYITKTVGTATVLDVVYIVPAPAV